MSTSSWARSLFARKPRTLRQAPARCRLSVESLEDRLVPTTFTASRLADDALAGSLRWAINQANAVPGDDTITFSVTGPTSYRSTCRQRTPSGVRAAV